MVDTIKSCEWKKFWKKNRMIIVSYFRNVMILVKMEGCGSISNVKRWGEVEGWKRNEVKKKEKLDFF